MKGCAESAFAGWVWRTRLTGRMNGVIGRFSAKRLSSSLLALLLAWRSASSTLRSLSAIARRTSRKNARATLGAWRDVSSARRNVWRRSGRMQQRRAAARRRAAFRGWADLALTTLHQIFAVEAAWKRRARGAAAAAVRGWRRVVARRSLSYRLPSSLI